MDLKDQDRERILDNASVVTMFDDNKHGMHFQGAVVMWLFVRFYYFCLNIFLKSVMIEREKKTIER
jgi:hypothetical protein